MDRAGRNFEDGRDFRGVFSLDLEHDEDDSFLVGDARQHELEALAPFARLRVLFRARPFARDLGKLGVTGRELARPTVVAAVADVTAVEGAAAPRAVVAGSQRSLVVPLVHEGGTVVDTS